MKDIEMTIDDRVVVKKAVNEIGRARLRHERHVYERLAGSAHIAAVLSFDDDSLTLERVHGTDVRQWLNLKESWTCEAQPWLMARDRLWNYAAAESDFLNRGIMYRDLNPEHLIFSGDNAVLIDLEEAVTKDGKGEWHLNSQRGTWETMAPEEFPAYGELTERTATYRVAVIAHLALAGELPFPRKPVPVRKTMHAWRKKHPARISGSVPEAARKVLSAALSRQPTRRHKDPAVFLQKLADAYSS